MKKKLWVLTVMCVGIFHANAQVGINTIQPKATLDVVGSPTVSTVLDGIIAPRITGSELRQKIYTGEQEGAIVYVTVADSAPAGQTIDVTTSGYYYFDGSKWARMIGEKAGTNWRIVGNLDSEVVTSAEVLGTAPVSKNYIGTKGTSDNFVIVTGNKTHAVLDTSGGLMGGGENASVLSWGSGNTINSTSNNIALGRNNKAEATAADFPAVAIGQENTVTGGGKVFGTGNTANLSTNYAFGANNKTGSSAAVAVGYANDASKGGYAYGSNNVVTTNNYAFGNGMNISGTGSSMGIGFSGKTTKGDQTLFANKTHYFMGQAEEGTPFTDVGINVDPSTSNIADLEISKGIQINTNTSTSQITHGSACSSSDAGTVVYVESGSSGSFLGCKKSGSSYTWASL
ncbi:hypothetical protein [Chryseobacterium oryctis]|uniref:Head domain of trimeric autotransporter adhesin n=1 Tax=Chryseobacterium oryctis TaxID=2952618 RepID=A0ABT3HK86_9FLAO|nr:hypothetical protein [Chryseobacterium oryctis]MCW3160207.1 hypothetical protein [Chryseobacterium oryctis]